MKFTLNYILISSLVACGTTPITQDARVTTETNTTTLTEAIGCGIVATVDGALVTCSDKQVLIKNGKDGAVGATGPQGAIGPVGPSGPAGAQGAAGADGAIGPQGSQGTTGAQGAQGATGPQGEAGPRGETGATGPTGERGIAGTNGTNGVNGKDGSPGLPGASGSIITPIIPCPLLTGAFPEVLLCINDKLYAVFVETKLNETHYAQIPAGSYITTDGRSCAFRVTTNCTLGY